MVVVVVVVALPQPQPQPNCFVFLFFKPCDAKQLRVLRPVTRP